MKKIISIILLGGLLVLTSNYNIGLFLYIPVVTILSSLGILYPLYSLLGGILSAYFFSPNLLIPITIFTLSLYLVKKIKLGRPEIIVLLASSVNYLIMKDIILTSICMLGSTLLYIALSFTLNKKKTIINYFEPLITALFLFASLGATQIEVQNINLGYIVSLLGIMYLSTNQYYFYSIIASGVSSAFFVLNNYIGVFLYLCSLTYFLPRTLNSIVFAGVVISSMFMNLFDNEYLLVTLLVIAVNEVITSLFFKKEDKIATLKNIYKNLTENMNNQILNYVAFLEEFSNNNIYPKEYMQTIEENTMKVIRQVCTRCQNKKCLSKNKFLINRAIKDLLKGNTLDTRSQSLFKQCKNKHQMHQIVSKLNEGVTKSFSKKESSLMSQIEGFSNILKNYVIDTVSSPFIEEKNFIKVKDQLIKNGLNITLFEIKKPYLNDFRIDIAIRGTDFDDVKKGIESIARQTLNSPINVKLLNKQRITIFVSITPDINYDISYGFSSLAKKGLSVSGDNYLVKPLSNGKFLAAISDGMGHGYNAHHESKSLINLINKVSDLNIDTKSSVDIINTLYNMQEFLDQYATLDLFEIDRNTGKSTLFKFGSTHTYIVKETGGIVKLFNENLPIGILNKVESSNIEIENNDLIIMITDGIIEQISTDNKFEDFIVSLKDKHAQKVAYDIINYSTTLQNNNNRDDMAVITLKVKERAA
ncbi:SpoIIE family protein phosphatase [Mycoplasmatota bacterium zrk1]